MENGEYKLETIEEIKKYYDKFSDLYINVITSILNGGCETYNEQKNYITERLIDYVMIKKHCRLRLKLKKNKIYIYKYKNDELINFTLRNNIEITTTLNQLNYIKILIDKNIFDDIINNCDEYHSECINYKKN